MSAGPQLTTATPDDWIVTVQMLSPLTGKRYARHVAVNGWVPEATAIRIAHNHACPRARREGRAHRVLSVDACRFHLWKPPADVRPRSFPMTDTMKV